MNERDWNSLCIEILVSRPVFVHPLSLCSPSNAKVVHPLEDCGIASHAKSRSASEKAVVRLLHEYSIAEPLLLVHKSFRCPQMTEAMNGGCARELLWLAPNVIAGRWHHYQLPSSIHKVFTNELQPLSLIDAKCNLATSFAQQIVEHKSNMKHYMIMFRLQSLPAPRGDDDRHSKIELIMQSISDWMATSEWVWYVTVGAISRWTPHHDDNFPRAQIPY